MRLGAGDIGNPGTWRCVAALACACAFVAPARAQVSGSLGIVSDYRYRGYSLSDGDPSMQGDLEYNATGGAYVGLFAATVRNPGESRGGLWIPYAGFARRDHAGRSWDVGVRWSHFDSTDGYDFPEWHVGVAWRRVTLRAHYAHDYFGGVPGVYVEADGAIPFRDRWHLLLHAGAAHDVDGSGVGTRWDARFGASLDTHACEVSLSWQLTRGGTGYPYDPPWNPYDRDGWVLGCVHRW